MGTRNLTGLAEQDALQLTSVKAMPINTGAYCRVLFCVSQEINRNN